MESVQEALTLFCPVPLSRTAEDRAGQGKAFARLLKKLYRRQASMNSTEPSVDLIHQEISHGAAILDTLQLMFRDGKPTLFWAVSWRGGFSHADGADGHAVIPSEMLPSLTAESLTDWMLHTLRESVLSLADFPAFAKDERAISWCEAVRRMYQPAAEK